MIGIGISNSVGAYRSFVDPAASAFFAATGLTGATERNAVNTLVTSLKSAGLWSKMKAVYPFVTDNRNLLSYTEDFGNAVWLQENVVITANSALSPNNTLTADTISEGSTLNFHNIRQIPAALSGSNIVFSVYINKNTARYVRLILSGGSSTVWTAAQFDLDTLTFTGGAGTSATGSFVSASITQASNGFYRCEIVSSLGGANITNSWISLSDGSAIVNTNNFGRVSYQGTNKSVYLWGAQVEPGSTATTYQPIATTQQSYISNQFKYNLVNPVDSDAAFRLVFNGGWTMSNQGATPNGTNGYADTKLVPSSVLSSQNSQHYSMYSRTNVAESRYGFGSDDVRLGLKWGDGILYAKLGIAELGYGTNSTSLGLHLMSRTDSTNLPVFVRNTKINMASVSSSLSGLAILLGARQLSASVDSYGSRQLAFSSIGDGLTDTEATALYNAVQTFNTSLSRQV